MKRTVFRETVTLVTCAAPRRLDRARRRHGGHARRDRSGADDTWCLQVNVVDTDARRDVPHEVDGVAVVVRVTGHVGAG
ncbi:hypothetical protein EQW78_13305 [Oerskovia turbata]|uniref:Uncharacterized protein n=1 Tax=Oerskovia turbata TaxID=1713 RepID=A0A4Q1KSX3_9CELL|nr:hypothetical protein [Oerskovia turbata]RXR25349.1 hypothetical protein EQW73_10880 [Oerskovia turbata]RXR32710.1 hypothetical protein EQW78_13305 [Oerskovia turbata]TGJ95612.1 hypothetical protein DLJ96_13875 [Actinotalea fermentans ATCC 43279 = JCM 9966 = DSM 3133]